MFMKTQKGLPLNVGFYYTLGIGGPKNCILIFLSLVTKQANDAYVKRQCLASNYHCWNK